jgi:hypothetical protein
VVSWRRVSRTYWCEGVLWKPGPLYEGGEVLPAGPVCEGEGEEDALCALLAGGIHVPVLPHRAVPRLPDVQLIYNTGAQPTIYSKCDSLTDECFRAKVQKFNLYST